MKTPLNQVYRQSKTFSEYPQVKKTFDQITKFSIEHDFVERYPDGGVRVKGRRYDDAVLFNSGVDFTDKVVGEFGARDGIFGAWLTQFVKKIYISDYFEEWGKDTEYDLGQMNQWKKTWEDCAYDKDKIDVSTQDMTKLTYPDNFFDIVVCTSVIEHTYNQCEWNGDKVSIKELARVLKPGGIMLLSTDMTKESKWISGTFYYSEKDLFDRLIDHSGLTLNGDYDFSLDHEDNDAMTTHNGYGPVAPCVFSLTKPL